MNNCKRCGNTTNEFYDSNKSWCKECIKSRARQSRIDRLDAVKEYERVRGRTRKRKAKVRAYAKTEKGKAARARASKAWRQRNKLKVAAHSAVARALSSGLLIRQPCEVCGATPAEAHHDDYTKPLDVRWLCDEHHKHHHQVGRAR